MNLSFAGCGFLGIYHVGVAVCFKRYAPHLLLDKISGASAGAIAACCLLCDLPIADMTSQLLRLAKEARTRTLGPFSPSLNVQHFLLDSLQKLLPDDAHLRVSGKLHISLTRVYDGKNVIVSQYNSREDVLQALLASSFIPLFCGLLPPRFHGIRYMDGGFSDNLPTLDENTITVSPFCGESDICPRDLSSQLFHVNLANTSIELSRQNMYRFARILFPPDAEILSNMCKQGFDDALRFLTRNNLINCNRCLAVQSTFVIPESVDLSEDSTTGNNKDNSNNKYSNERDCDDCRMHRQEALVANLPETVLMLFQEAIDSANKGLVNWLFKHRSVRLLSLLSLPYTLPADVVYATFTKFVLNAPKLQKSLMDMTRYFLEQLSLIFPKINVYYQPMPQTIKCHVNIMDYGSNMYSDDEPLLYKPHKANVNVTLEYDDNAKTWTDCGQSTNCVINVSNLTPSGIDNRQTASDNFENMLQATADREALMAYYYVEDGSKVHFSEIIDINDDDDNDNRDNQQFSSESETWKVQNNDEELNRLNSEMSSTPNSMINNETDVSTESNHQWYFSQQQPQSYQQQQKQQQQSTPE
ncbi:patatin-like phospholipase domain-containing protein 2 [Trichogramma pretiosum]|uniref:patatin-like phospholipase domain-containing protein 2 n=1 Tax=Trichogramma pretiosum TaxID=7493 RepID=UPI0006C967D6|nr:patatin-like phospholipase domain-containing protein 2 [Trichogramma pretiosum]